MRYSERFTNICFLNTNNDDYIVGELTLSNNYRWMVRGHEVRAGDVLEVYIDNQWKEVMIDKAIEYYTIPFVELDIGTLVKMKI